MKIQRLLLLLSLLLISACGTRAASTPANEVSTAVGAKNITVYKSPT